MKRQHHLSLNTISVATFQNFWIHKVIQTFMSTGKRKWVEPTSTSVTINFKIKFSFHSSDIDITPMVTCVLEVDTQSWNLSHYAQGEALWLNTGSKVDTVEICKISFTDVIQANMGKWSKTCTSCQRNGIIPRISCNAKLASDYELRSTEDNGWWFIWKYRHKKTRFSLVIISCN